MERRGGASCFELRTREREKVGGEATILGGGGQGLKACLI